VSETEETTTSEPAAEPTTEPTTEPTEPTTGPTEPAAEPTEPPAFNPAEEEKTVADRIEERLQAIEQKLGLGAEQTDTEGETN